jgi:hypothetical protein
MKVGDIRKIRCALRSASALRKLLRGHLLIVPLRICSSSFRNSSRSRAAFSRQRAFSSR